MMRRIAYTAFCLVGLLCGLASCRNDDLTDSFGETAERLTARKGELLTRSASPNAQFEADTYYRLWAYGGTDGQYLFGETLGVLGKETKGHYVLLDKLYAKELKDRFDIYGFTDGKPKDQEPTDLWCAPNTRPCIDVCYDDQLLPQGYPDYMRAHLHYDRQKGLTSSVMEFKHILSRIRLQVIQQGKKNESAQGGEDVGRFNLKLHKITIEGVYDHLTYDIIDGKFSESGADNSPKQNRTNRTLKEHPEGYDIPVRDKDYLETFILPTAGLDTTSFLRIKLEISGDSAALFADKVAPVDGKYTVTVKLTDRMKPDTDGKYNTPLVFRPNCAYMLRMVFAQDGIILFTPTVYPWFDGETDNEENGEWYEEQALGNTMLFDNLIWSDRNLGAEDFYPADKSRYEKCTGFFYQFGRNIPYFPMVNENGVLRDSLVDATPVYPVVSHAEGRRHKPDTKNSPFPEDKFILKPEEINEGIKNGKQLGYSVYGLPSSNLWNDVDNQPAPPGWRLPTQQEFFGIMPTTPHAGNITFLRNLNYNWAGNVGNEVSADFYNNKDVDVIYIHVPNSDSYPNYPEDKEYIDTINKNTINENVIISGPSSANVIKQPGDPYGNYASEYLISRRYPDETGKPLEETNPGVKSTLWGTIYGIKKVGTNEAYRMRWRIVRAQENVDLYYLVIERYTATATDRLSRFEKDANYYRKYKWDRPVAVLYLPINGIVGDYQWEGGNFQIFGKEVIFATSEESSRDSYKTFRIKIAGTVRNNQFIAPSVDRKGTGAQIRLVRESTYQPNRK